MIHGFIRPVCMFVLPVMAVLILSACDSDDSPAGTPDRVKGFGISPRGFPLDYSNILEFYSEVAGMPDSAVMWNGAWRDDVAGGADAGEIPSPAAGTVRAAETYGFTPILVFGWRSGETPYLKVPSNQVNDWTNARARELFLTMLADAAGTLEPPFMFLGNENDAYYEQAPEDYENWITFYNAAYDAVKDASPHTLAGPVFNFEHMAGSGALNGWTTHYWGALESHDLSRVDIVGVTLYPWLNHRHARDVPLEYLDPPLERIGSKPVAITETGWPAEDPGTVELPWESSEEQQVAYLSRLEEMLGEKNIKIVNWLFLYPMANPGDDSLDWQLFGSVSLRDFQAHKRPAYDRWLMFQP